MSLDYDTYPLKELNEGASVFSGFAFKSKDFSDEGIPIVKIKNIQNKSVDLGEVQYFPLDKVTNKHEKFFLKDNDVLIAMTGQGSLGRVGRINLESDELVLLNQRVGKFVVDEKNLHLNYLYHVISSDMYEKILFDRGTGSGQPNLSPEIILGTEIPMPDLSTQKRIASILDNINSKINLNKKINKNLTKLIDATFKNYLLNFENYSEDDLVSSEFGSIPKGWEVNNLTGIANYQNGLAMQKFPPETPENSFKVLKIKELRQGFFDESSDLCSKNIKEECIVYDGDVIFSWSGSLLVDIWTGGTCGLNQHLFKVTSSYFDKWFYYCWTKFYLDQFILIAKDKATTMGHIKRQHLEESLVLIPDKETYKNLTNIFKPLFEYLIKNKIEIKKLQSLRDTLLPKLMSGEIDVSKINCDLE